MITIIDGIFILLLCGFMFSFGYKIACVEDNNYSELFQAYIKNNTDLEREKYYWMDCYNKLYYSIPDELIEYKVVDMQGRVIRVFFKEE